MQQVTAAKSLPVRVYAAPLADRHVQKISAAGGQVVDLEEPPAGGPAVLLRTVGRRPLADFRTALACHQDIRWVHTVGAGPDDLIDVIPEGVTFTKGPGPSAEPVAEYVIAALLHLIRRFPVLVEAHRERTWRKPFRAPALDEQTAAILGWGPIGQTIAAKCRRLGMEVVVVRRTPPDGPSPFRQYPTAQLVDVLTRAQALVLACPLTPETRGLIGKPQLEALGPEGVLVNVSRGGVVDQDALMDALGQGVLGGAVLDVVDPEPLPSEHPLWRAPRCLITPHLAGFAGQTLGERVIDLFCENLARFVQRQPLLHVVDLQLGY